MSNYRLKWYKSQPDQNTMTMTLQKTNKIHSFRHIVNFVPKADYFEFPT